MGGGYATPIPLRTVHTASPMMETGRTDQWLKIFFSIWFLSGSGYVLNIPECWELLYFPVGYWGEPFGVVASPLPRSVPQCGPLRVLLTLEISQPLEAT